MSQSFYSEPRSQRTFWKVVLRRGNFHIEFLLDNKGKLSFRILGSGGGVVAARPLCLQKTNENNSQGVAEGKK